MIRRSDFSFACDGHIGRSTRWVAVLCALALVLIAAPAQAALKYGVSAGTAPTDGELQRLAQGNAEVIRTELRWDEVERNPAAYDRLVNTAAIQGRQLLPILGGAPADVLPKPDEFPSGAPLTSNKDAMDRLRSYLRTIVGRYGVGNGGPIRDWQIFNEPNIKQFAAAGKVNPKEYARLLKISSKTIRSADPSARIVLAGMPEFTRTNVGNMNFKDYLTKLYREKSVTKLFDAVAIHPYTTSKFGADGVEGAFIRTRQLLKKLGDRKRKVQVTETGFGVPPATRDRLGGGFIVSESKQAKLLGQIFNRTRAGAKKYGLQSIFWFSFRDFDTQRGFWYNFSGLFREGGDSRPSWERFTSFTGGQSGGGASIAGKSPSSSPFLDDDEQDAEREAQADVLASPPE